MKNVADPHSLPLSLKINGELRQEGNTRSMIFSVDAIIAYLSNVFTLEEGDLIFTGTPKGVGAVARGDILEAALGSLAHLRVRIA